MENPYKFVEKWAILTPNQPALANSRVELSFRQLYIKVNQIAVALKAAGVKRGDIVVTLVAPRTDVEIMLALMFLGAASASGTSEQAASQAHYASWFVVDSPKTALDPLKTITLDSDFLNSASNISEFVKFDGFEVSSSLFRLIFTSGTTGKPKAAAFTFDLYSKRFDNYSAEMARNLDQQGISLMGVSSAGGFRHALQTLGQGKCVLVRNQNDPAKSMVDVARKFKVSQIVASPIQLASFVKQVGADLDGLENLSRIRVGGTSTSPQLVRIIKEKFQIDLELAYGSTEGGNVATRLASITEDSTNVGVPSNQVKLEIVDDSGSCVEPGVIGKVRYQTPYMIDGYFMNPTNTSISFVEGWFYPGDLGQINLDGSVTILGRSNDQINSGGVKVDPAEIDRWAADYPGVEDCAAFAIEDDLGIVWVAIAVVAGPKFDERRFLDVSKRELKIATPRKVFRVQNIPRNDMGKIQRNLLSKRFSKK